MKRAVYLFILIITITLAVNSCKKDGDLYFKYRASNTDNMITSKGAELYTFSVNDTALKVGSYHAKIQGVITTYGNKIIQYGHCWGTTENPVLNSNANADTLKTTNESEGFSTDSAKTVTYESRMSYLVKSTKYYVRSYIITADEQGNVLDTGYNVNSLLIETLRPVDEWYEKPGGDKPGSRFGAVAFNKGDTVFFGTGNQSFIGAINPILNKDMWMYDPATDTWKSIAALPISGNNGVTGAVGFALTYKDVTKPAGSQYRTKLYVGLGDYVGNDVGTDKKAIFYELDITDGVFDSEGNPREWNSLPLESYPGHAVSNAVSFVIDDRAYVGSGKATTWRYEWYLFDPTSYYDPNNNNALWRSTSFPGSSVGREGAIAFSVNGRGYYGLGIDQDGKFLNDFYQFTPRPGNMNVAEGVWDKKTDFPGAPRANAVGLRIDDQGYVGTGDNITALDGAGNATAGDAMSDFYRYDPFNNLWYELADYTNNTENPTREKKITRAVGFYSTSSDFGYIGYGAVVDKTPHAQQDVWYYNPW